MDYFKPVLIILIVSLSFHVLAADESTVEVGIAGNCRISTTGVNPPGNTSTNPPVIGKEKLGLISTTVYNHGNVRAEVMADINVTYEGNNSWQPREDLGPTIDLSTQEANYSANYSIRYRVPPNATSPLEKDEQDWRFYLRGFNTSYPGGNYTVHFNYNYSCDVPYEDNSSTYEVNKTDHAYGNFIIIETVGESGGVNTTGNKSAPPTPENINQTGDENATIGNTSGSQEANVTRPENYSELGNQTVNKTLPQDVNQTGEESDLPLEGNNDAPGVTPQPEPEPEPDPQPRFVINIEPVNTTYTAYQGQYAAAAMTVENVGNQSVNDITLDPMIDQVRPDWQVRNAQIANLSAGEKVTRDVFIRPPEDQEPGLYVVPIVAENTERRLDVDYFTIKVNQSEFQSKMEILEVPQSVSVEVNSTQRLPILIENTGKRDLENITAELQNIEDCGSINSNSVSALAVNETGSMEIKFDAGNNPESCNATLVVSSADGAYSFTNINFSTTPKEGLIPQKQQVPLIAILWTVLLMAYAILKKRYDLNSTVLKMPFLLLLVGETVILLYMVVNYYGVVSVSFLPF